LISSAANIIVDEKANHVDVRLRLGAWEYFKFGFVSTIIVTITGLFIIAGLANLSNYDISV